MLRFLARTVGEADDREPGNSRLEMRFDLDPPRLETDQRMRDRTSEHAATVGTKASPKGNAFVPNCYRLVNPYSRGRRE
jgi:hypothetical protein